MAGTAEMGLKSANWLCSCLGGPVRDGEGDIPPKGLKLFGVPAALLPLGLKKGVSAHTPHQANVRST